MALTDLNKSPRCQHIHVTGKPCKAPARRGRSFCVFHQAAHLEAGCVLPVIEDLHSYQVAIIRILRALSEDIIDSKKATALLYGLQLVGSKLDRFVDERKHVENPIASLKDEVFARHSAENSMKRTFDGIPAADLRRILADLAAEQSEPNQNAAAVPNPEEGVISSEDAAISTPGVAAHAASRDPHPSQPAALLNEIALPSTGMEQPHPSSRAPRPGIIDDIRAALAQTQRVSPQAHPQKPTTNHQRPITTLPPAVSLSPARA